MTDRLSDPDELARLRAQVHADAALIEKHQKVVRQLIRQRNAAIEGLVWFIGHSNESVKEQARNILDGVLAQ